CSLHGVLLTTESPETAQRNWRTVVDLLQTHHAEPVIAARYPLAQVGDAFNHLAKDVFGKVVVDVG
ncbi:MAG TPA: zinc-binding dehydrogenase, partial [Planctomycetaceae bacterium]|nr:zinc-binding dehydrogenase [Planctomycetaceae bacterium]